MKRIIKLLSVALACAMLICAIPFSAGANDIQDSFGLDTEFNIEPPLYQPQYIYDDSKSIDDVMREFDEFCNYCNSYYPAYAYSGYVVGVHILAYDSSMKTLNSALSDAKSLYDNYVNSRSNSELMPTLTEIRATYEAVVDAAKNMRVSIAELRKLVNLCATENNDDNYYDDNLWNTFSARYTSAQEILNADSVEPESVDTAYWNLFNAINKLCTANTLRCDVNNDGRVNIVDATLLQKVIAKLSDFNFSQRFNSISGKYSENPTITDVTYLQKYLGGYDCPLSVPGDFTVLQENSDNKLWRKNIMIYNMNAPYHV